MKFIFRALKSKEGFKFNRDKFDEIARNLKDGEYILKLERKTAKRSDNQNRLWHFWMGIFADYMGYLNKEEACIAIKRHLGYCRKVKNKLGDEEEVCKSTADMNTPEMYELMSKTVILAAEHGLQLPTPEDIEP